MISELIMVNHVQPSSEEIDRQIEKYMTIMESEIGEDIIPITMIMMCRIAVKYGLNINWVLNTILMGYHNEAPPDIPMMAGDKAIKYDS